MQKQIKEFTDIAIELQKRNIEVGYKNKLTKFYNKYLEYALSVATIGILLGISLTILGFTLWYIKLQKYQDLVLLKEAQQNQTNEKPNKPAIKRKPRLKT